MMIDFVSIMTIFLGFVVGICVANILNPKREAHGELIVTENAEDGQAYMFLALYKGFNPESITDGKILLNIKNGNAQK